MQVKYRTPDGRFEIIFESVNHKSTWNTIAHFESIFSDTNCKSCGEENTKFVVRGANTAAGKKCEYYELVCPACRAKKDFGQLSDGSDDLFPKRKDGDGNWLEDNGWYKWDGGKSK